MDSSSERPLNATTDKRLTNAGFLMTRSDWAELVFLAKISSVPKRVRVYFFVQGASFHKNSFDD